MQQINSFRPISSLIGDKVLNMIGEELGEIEDILIDGATGSISHAVISVGGILGIGKKHYCISWNKLEMHREKPTFLLDIPIKSLKNSENLSVLKA